MLSLKSKYYAVIAVDRRTGKERMANAFVVGHNTKSADVLDEARKKTAVRPWEDLLLRVARTDAERRDILAWANDRQERDERFERLMERMCA